MATWGPVSRYVHVILDDGGLYVPEELVQAVGEEYDARSGALNVAEAQHLVEKWGKPSLGQKPPKTGGRRQ